MAVKIYSTPTCPWCQRAKDFLNTKGVKYEDVNVAENQEARMEMIEKTGQLGVPVIDVDGKVIIGFDQTAIEHALT